MALQPVTVDPSQLTEKALLLSLLDAVTTLNANLNTLLVVVTKGFATMSAQLDALAAQVQQTVTVEQSAITLIQGLAAQIAANANDPAQITALAAQLNTNAAALAAAIAANTPAAPPPTTGGTGTTPPPAGA